eukprot:scaffold4528_cov162-Amphora_coffeaeformis.AAC.6
MNESLHSLVYGDEEFLVEASQAAQQTIAAAIRRVLRAVAVQALKQQLQNKPPQEANRIVLTQQDIQEVQSYCQQLAKRWSQANAAMGNEQMAASIVDLAQRESATLYFMEDDYRDETNDNLSTIGDGTATTNPVAPTPQQQQQIFATAHTRIRSLPAQPLHETIATLDRLGTRHQTYWPVSWRTIQAAAVQIPYRLYKNTAAEEIVEILPASQAPPDAPKRKAVDWLMDRKRKSVGRERLPPKRVKPAAKTAKPPPPPPRPPSNVSTCQWTIQEVRESFNASERQYLDKLVIGASLSSNAKTEPDEEDVEEESSPPSMMMGALMELGHYHHYQQSGIDFNGEDGPRVADLKKRQRWQRRSKKERLADHVEADTDYGIAAKRASCSKVVQCKDAVERKWRDLDIQQCWVEVFDGTTRHVLAFDTMEMLLLDEDEAAEGWHDEEF